ncbi:unnamed protein product [Discosporangium mesarthrocarpum]
MDSDPEETVNRATNTNMESGGEVRRKSAEDVEVDAGPGFCFKSALIRSSIPPQCLQENSGDGVTLGIDEAGRGPVLGPMVYGGAFWSCSDDKEVSSMGFDDSKALTPAQRDGLFDRLEKTPQVGWVLRLISAKELSSKMCRRTPYSLNAISHDAAIEIIKSVQSAGVKINEVFVDTVGDPSFYQKRLEREFASGIKFTVAKRADSLYKTVSAASILAKVTRDRILDKWQWSEPNLAVERTYGSGYPSDDRCKRWMEDSVDPVFGFPDICRFSWATTKEKLEKLGKRVEW